MCYIYCVWQWENEKKKEAEAEKKTKEDFKIISFFSRTRKRRQRAGSRQRVVEKEWNFFCCEKCFTRNYLKSRHHRHRRHCRRLDTCAVVAFKECELSV